MREESKLGEKFYQFMKGRNGVDEYSRAISLVAVVLSIINIWLRSGVVSGITIAILAYSLYRSFSKDLTKRSKENAKFLRDTNGIRKPFKRLKRRLFGENGYKYFSCKSCKTELRVPKGKGKIKVRCPKCKEEMTTKS